MPTIWIPATYKDYRPGQDATDFGALERELSKLVESHPRQERIGMFLHPILHQAASMKCLDMANRNYGAHVDPDGHGPNWLVRQLGYRLPDYYGQEDDNNNIESLYMGGNGDLYDMWPRWLASENHRNHLLGLNDFYRAQTNYGVGYAYNPDSSVRFYWCFLSAPPEPVV